MTTTTRPETADHLRAIGTLHAATLAALAASPGVKFHALSVRGSATPHLALHVAADLPAAERVAAALNLPKASATVYGGSGTVAHAWAGEWRGLPVEVGTLVDAPDTDEPTGLVLVAVPPPREGGGS